MPIYEYRCPQGHSFEVFQRMSDPPPDGCIECGAGPVEKILFPVAVHFRGSGFYSTDYGRGKRTSRDDSTGGGDSKPAETKKDTGSADKKAAAAD